ncbi:MAG: HAD-IIIA family hydrolase [Bacteroidota bacterium]
MRSGAEIRRKAARIRMLLMDVDGVMTDGGVYYSARGLAMKRFHAHDGYGAVLCREAGLRLGMVSGRESPLVALRARDLGVDELLQGVADKHSVLAGLQAKYSLRREEFAYIGDDLFDLPLLGAVGLSGAPADARKEVRGAVDYVCRQRGGEGALREFMDLIRGARRRTTGGAA